MVGFVLESNLNKSNNSNCENHFFFQNNFNNYQFIDEYSSTHVFHGNQQQVHQQQNIISQNCDFNFISDNSVLDESLNDIRLENFNNSQTNNIMNIYPSISFDSKLNTSFDSSSNSSVNSVASTSFLITPTMKREELELVDKLFFKDEIFGFSEKIDKSDKNKSSSNTNFIESKKKYSRSVKKIKKKPENMKDCLHVWEFLRDLLRSAESNNKLIKWLNKEKGLFKILMPNEVSNLWGKKKANKEKMDYPNMARGIRYSREEGGYFDLVTKNDGFGKKLVYKFSKKASLHCDWLNSFMK